MKNIVSLPDIRPIKISSKLALTLTLDFFPSICSGARSGQFSPVSGAQFDRFLQLRFI